MNAAIYYSGVINYIIEVNFTSPNFSFQLLAKMRFFVKSYLNMTCGKFMKSEKQFEIASSNDSNEDEKLVVEIYEVIMPDVEPSEEDYIFSDEK
ncbi:hypothetical protein [Mucilaginibacter sp. PAMB04168]|uniref:hypothetical protein n=1 Tax=Mucilaginibacter sp. PAMB04168 TaxID=3138567 RepID=UPI0031F68C23